MIIEEQDDQNETGSLAAVGFDAWGEDLKDDAAENKVWDEFYKNRK